MSKALKLNQLKAKLLAENPAIELASGATQLVFGDGNPDADVMFVGEAPGKNEDKTGLPFVGAAGKFLDEMLESVQLSRKDVYITNIVKYRPPENRDPSADEKKEFWPYLLQQISIIKPKIVATLGRHSGQAFQPDLHISADHGVPSKHRFTLEGSEEEIVVVPLYHPAAALYNGSLRKTLLEDFKIVTNLLNNEI